MAGCSRFSLPKMRRSSGSSMKHVAPFSRISVKCPSTPMPLSLSMYHSSALNIQPAGITGTPHCLIRRRSAGTKNGSPFVSACTNCSSRMPAYFESNPVGMCVSYTPPSNAVTVVRDSLIHAGCGPGFARLGALQRTALPTVPLPGQKASRIAVLTSAHDDTPSSISSRMARARLVSMNTSAVSTNSKRFAGENSGESRMSSSRRFSVQILRCGLSSSPSCCSSPPLSLLVASDSLSCACPWPAALPPICRCSRMEYRDPVPESSRALSKAAHSLPVTMRGSTNQPPVGC
mmetsp:Transcript_40090/g.82105  ORF Transcript_40090/g.82105 Transcript_40090/m.82105 type:complete len:290 (-) Transcript_40090:82-951(-)